MQARIMITGAGSGLGREMALRWAREGCQLALSDVNDAGLAETLKGVREAGGDRLGRDVLGEAGQRHAGAKTLLAPAVF